MWSFHPEILAKPVPRYTSYPTAMAFTSAVGPSDYKAALRTIEPGAEISLYIHVPYCRSICWYCGCNTGMAGRTHRLTSYLQALKAEMQTVSAIIGRRQKVGRIAFGGGSPNAIEADELRQIMAHCASLFDIADGAISIEIDPRAFTEEWADAMAGIGVTRVSLGVQSFSAQIQAAIGREQPLSMVAHCVESLRARGVSGINFDLMYGLPGQTIETLDETLDEVIALRPDRIALFGYAHLPSMFPRQRRIDASTLPDTRARFEQSEHGYRRLVEAGYRAIGFDHFALPGDSLARADRENRVRRNFQGFTEDQSDILLGIGASAISQFPHLIVQNEKDAGPYRDLCGAGSLATARGVLRTAEDQTQGSAIEALLCRGEASIPDLSKVDTEGLSRLRELGLIDGDESKLALAPGALPYARHVAAVFDRH